MLNKKIKILMLGTSINTKGGVSSVVNQYLNSDLVKIFNIKYIETHCDGHKLKKLVVFLKGVLIFLKEIFIFRPKIIHIHSASRASFYRKSVFVLVSKIFRKKVIFHLHGGQFMIFYGKESGPIKKRVIKWILKLNDKVVVLSQTWEKEIKSISSDIKTVVIFNSVNLPAFYERYSTNLPKLLFMGRIGKKKGFHDLVKAVQILKQNGFKFKCFVCGDGNIQLWQKRCQELGVGEFFDFKGWVKGKEKENVLKRVDIFVLPSYNEGVPMAMLEAMAYALPVVATNVGGIPEIVKHNYNGFIIKPGDVNSLAHYLEILMLSNELRKRMGLNSRKIIAENFTIEKAVKDLSHLYSELIVYR